MPVIQNGGGQRASAGGEQGLFSNPVGAGQEAEQAATETSPGKQQQAQTDEPSADDEAQA